MTFSLVGRVGEPGVGVNMDVRDLSTPQIREIRVKSARRCITWMKQRKKFEKSLYIKILLEMTHNRKLLQIDKLINQLSDELIVQFCSGMRSICK